MEKHAAETPDLPPPAPALARRPGQVLSWLAGAVLVLLGLFLVGYIPQHRRQGALVVEARRASAPPRVRVTAPRRAGADHVLKLPGTVQALKETAIYARTSGYLQRWYVDLGSPVKAGQVLADIDTPEVDQEQAQAQATLAQAQAGQEQARTDLEYARVSLARVKALAPSGVSSQQDLDQRNSEHQAAQAKLGVAEANVHANQANLRRLTELKSFAHVVAPFAGVITARMTEVGSLVTAGTGGAQPLFRLAMTARVRVFIDVPQLYAAGVRVGQAARVLLREQPDRVFGGQVTHLAQALDAAAHTMVVEVQMPNEDGGLMPGTYAQVELSVPMARPVLLVDATALVIGADGPTLALIGPGDRVHLQRVTIDVDYGGEVGIATGLREDDRVVLNPGERIGEGVQVVPLSAGGVK